MNLVPRLTSALYLCTLYMGIHTVSSIQMSKLELVYLVVFYLWKQERTGRATWCSVCVHCIRTCTRAFTHRTLWTLEMSLLVLPELHSLISSRHASHVKCGCKVVKLILKSFGPVIKTNMATPPSHGGVDITKEERYIIICLVWHTLMSNVFLGMRDVWCATPT